MFLFILAVALILYGNVVFGWFFMRRHSNNWLTGTLYFTMLLMIELSVLLVLMLSAIRWLYLSPMENAAAKARTEWSARAT
jgi:hypothetical protein